MRVPALFASLTIAFTVAGVDVPVSVATPVDLGRLEECVRYLGSEEFKGRGTGSPELERAAAWIRGRMQESLEHVESQRWTDSDGIALQNIVARWAPPSITDDLEWVVVGAHYDHLGVGESDDPHPGTTYPGADDNASGVAVLLEGIRVLTENYPQPERGILFVAFTGEENGLLGSRQFLRQQAVPKDRLRAMVNLDTIGHLDEGELSVFGVDSARQFRDILQGINSAFGIPLRLLGSSSGVSDDLPFIERGIPALHFFTGAHEHYHRPSDTPETIDFAGLVQITEYVVELVDYLGQEATRLDFVPEGADQALADPKRATEGRRRVSFGSIPDFQRAEGGVLLTGVIAGSPAERAGLQKGDLIVEFAGRPVDDLTDYSEAMKQLSPGDVVRVVFMRDEERHHVEVTVVERK